MYVYIGRLRGSILMCQDNWRGQQPPHDHHYFGIRTAPSRIALNKLAEILYRELGKQSTQLEKNTQSLAWLELMLAARLSYYLVGKHSARGPKYNKNMKSRKVSIFFVPKISIAENCNESQKTWFISTTNGFFATYVDKASMHHHIYLSGFYIFCRFSMFKLMQLQNCFWNLNSVYLWHHNLQSPVCFANMHCILAALQKWKINILQTWY